MRKKILIVDDSRTIRQQVSFTLTKGGFDVIEAEDGKDGIAKLKSNTDIAVVISDVNMPNMNGLEFIKNVKAMPGFRFTPILTLTTESQVEKRDEAKKLGATGWLIKPLAGSDLIKIIKQVLPTA